MPSERQVAANRSNAQKSTGPRTLAGREISRHNALRHGLAVAIGVDPVFRDQIKALANALFPTQNENPTAIAIEAAEAQLDIMRIRSVRAWLTDEKKSHIGAGSAHLAQVTRALTSLERYERRAFSRRKQAFRLIETSVK